MKNALVYLTVAAICLVLQGAEASVLWWEGFNYSAGSLSGNDSWLGAASGLTVGNGNNLSYPGLQDLGGNALIVTSGAAGSMTVNFSGSPITSGSIYYSFLAQCTALPTANSYLTDLLPLGGSPNGSGDPLAVYVGQQVAGSQFKIGVRHQGIGTGATYATSPTLTLNAVNFFVVKYTFGSGGSVSLFINPTPASSEPAPSVSVGPGGTEAANLQTLGFKANSATTAGNWVFDTLRVGDTWDAVVVPEPSTLALAGLGLALVAWRRKHC